MWKLLSGVILSSSIAVAVAAAPERTSQTLAHSEHHRCVERGFKAGTPQFRRCVSQRLSLQHRRAPIVGPLPSVPALSKYQTPPGDRTPDDPGRLTTSELQQTAVGPPVTVQAPRVLSLKQIQAREHVELEREADARRQALVDQTNETIRSDTGL
jgi:hypothetical protein